jgi:hypothetical protein
VWNLIKKLFRRRKVSWTDHVALEMRVASMVVPFRIGWHWEEDEFTTRWVYGPFLSRKNSNPNQ